MLFTDTDNNCNRERAFISIIITIIPSWAILTTLIVFALLSFHRNLRSTKVYDDCSKANAQYVYYLDLRTGDTSSSYNKRRTTLTIDMFDDNQATLARIFIPGHVIFGRKDAPIIPIEDEKFSDLRVTRFWLYRATKLKKVTTIRLTHSCTELDARIMVYAVELRTDEPERFRLFFPVMSYISVYGATNKPSTCFDAEPLGYMSAIGGHLSDQASFDEHLTWLDMNILLNLAASIVYYLTGQVLMRASTKNELLQFVYSGLIGGIIAFFITLVLGLAHRYIIRQNYALRLGQGYWSYTYYAYNIILLIAASILWIVTAVNTFKNLCPEQHLLWILSICIGFAVTIIASALSYGVNYIIHMLNPPYLEQYVVPDDLVPSEPSKSRQQTHFRHNLSETKRALTPVYGLPTQAQMANLGQVPVHNAYPNQPPIYSFQPYSQHQNAPPLLSYHDPSVIPPTVAKSDRLIGMNRRLGEQSKPQATNPELATLNQQVGNTEGKSGPKKVGSSESTGSNYYQQLIKTKGGVKSISQYGELLKQKKVKHQK